MVEVLADCAANYDHSGAVVVAIIFVSVFVVLILGDGVLSGIAIVAAVRQGDQAPDKVRLSQAIGVISSLVDLTPQEQTVLVAATNRL